MSNERRLLLNRYRLGKLIGQSRVFDVYLASDVQLNRQVVVKLVKPQFAADAAFNTRFRQEAQSAARMTDPTIVRVFDVGEVNRPGETGSEGVRTPFVVTEYVEGQLLKDLIDDGPLQPVEAIRVVNSVLTALERAHDAEVLHRDIQPGNIMITADGDVKVMDFGVARAVFDQSSTLAEAVETLGTAAYLSPEQARGEPVDARSDLYSVGVVLYEMLTGSPPFGSDTSVAVAYRHISERPPKPSEVNPRVSPALDALALRALSKYREDRYQTVAEFRADIEAAASGRMPEPRVSTEAPLLFDVPTSSLSSSELALRRLAEDERVIRTPRRPPVTWIGASVIGIVAIVIAVMFWAFTLQPVRSMPENARAIPTLIGGTYDEAAKRLQALGLPITRVNEISDTVTAEQVLRTDPPEGEVVDGSNTGVTVYVSSGRQPATVPDLRDQLLDLAKTEVVAAGLLPGKAIRENSPTAPADTVLGTTPEPGASVGVGATVDFRVSSGLVTIADLTGQTLAAASEYLAGPDRQFNPVHKPDPSCKSQSGSPVTTQSLAPGDVAQRSSVTLTFCSG